MRGLVAFAVGCGCVAVGLTVGIYRRDIGLWLAGEKGNHGPSAQREPTKSIADQPAKEAMPKEEPPPPPTPDPVLGWKVLTSETLELNPFEARSLGAVTLPERLKFSIHADEPIFFWRHANGRRSGQNKALETG
jgi:hypothetical protein